VDVKRGNLRWEQDLEVPVFNARKFLKSNTCGGKGEESKTRTIEKKPWRKYGEHRDLVIIWGTD